MLLDSYLNIIHQQANTTSGDNFHGVFGLGERAGPEFFFKDGIYSMWSRDIASPEEDGKTPGKNMYSTHPFYMFSNTETQWVGVFLNLAAAQDWQIMNDESTGQVNLTTIGVGGMVDLYLF